MRILYFGTYSKGEGYPRNKVIIEGLRQNGVEVIECHAPLWKGAGEKIAGIRMGKLLLSILPRLFSAYLILLRKFIQTGQYDLIIVGYSGHIDIFIARFLTFFRKSPLVFDAFLSLYDTGVLDRKVVRKDSLKARALWWIDKLSCSISDLVLLDTKEHIRFFVETFGLPTDKFCRVFAGAEWGLLKSGDNKEDIKNKGFEVLFFGTFIPLHGIDTIIKAASILKAYDGIHFTLIGKGQLYPETLQLVEKLKIKNLALIDRWVSASELTGYVKRASVCLGIFGTTNKAKRVIPYKVYGCLSMGKAVITGNTKAAKELLKDSKTAILVPVGDPSSLAKAILRLKGDYALIEKIGNNALRLFRERCSPEMLGRELKTHLERLIVKK
ncbi:MAG: glycosyltransferase [Thermodesulfobacteriota bacterium]